MTQRDMLAYHSGKRSAYANAGMPARAREHAHRAHCARFGSKRPRGESPTRGTPAERGQRREQQGQEPTEKKEQTWSEWLWGTSAPSAPAETPEAPKTDSGASVVATPRYACVGGGQRCDGDAVYAFAPCDHPLLCELHFQKLATQLERPDVPEGVNLADFLPKCAFRRTCKAGDSSAECCTVRRNPMVAKKLDSGGGHTYVTTTTAQRGLVPFGQRNKSVACGPCVNDIQVGALRVCDRPKRATDASDARQCAPLTSDELGRFYKAVVETWKYGAWITPQRFEWGTGRFGPGT